MPQTPWPEVQPLPRVTPTPTISPPKIKASIETGTSIVGIVPLAAKTKAGAVTIPAIIAIRQDQSVMLAGINAPARTPVAPAMRPCTIIKSTVAMPIMTPPVSDAMGVKSVSMWTRPYMFEHRSGGRAGKSEPVQ